jgi:hypothetical protein
MPDRGHDDGTSGVKERRKAGLGYPAVKGDTITEVESASLSFQRGSCVSVPENVQVHEGRKGS